ncbi:MAG TPA: hypothetical protein PLO99_14900 [Chitinophagaceae bacterium]|nr:hypothetical protein [Chitinophagaceae bacterium]
MRKVLIFFISYLFTAQVLLSQVPDSLSFKPPIALTKKDHSLGIYDSIHNRYYLICQTREQITRICYDSNFQLLNFYSFSADSLSIHWDKKKKAGLLGPLILQSGYFEVYNDGKRLLLIKPDYGKKKDSLVNVFYLPDNVKSESVVSIIPNKDALQVLTWRVKERKFLLYQIRPEQPVDIQQWILPATNFDSEDMSAFRKDVVEEMKIAFDKFHFRYLLPVQTSQSYFTESKFSVPVFYNATDLYIPCVMKAHSGYSLIRLNINNQKATIRNFYFNDLIANTNAQIGYDFKGLWAVIFDSTLLVKNQSTRYLAFHFFNAHSGQLIKEYQLHPKDGLSKLIHSDYNQFGTWLSPKQAREFSSPKNFLRKLTGSSIFVSGRSKDSITFTCMYYRYTMGIEGSLLALTTSMLTEAANIHIGRLQIIPYLYTDRDKLVFAHSRFSMSNLEPSAGEKSITMLDLLLNHVSLQDISANSSFIIKNKQHYILGILNPETKLFSVIKFHE